jgi:hypothetical protein
MHLKTEPMKKALRYSIVAITTTLFIILIVVAVMISKLPSAGEIKSKLVATTAHSADKNLQVDRSESNSSTSLPEGNLEPDSPFQQGEQKSTVQDPSATKAIEDLVFNRDRPLADVCDHLGDALRSPILASGEQKISLEKIVEVAGQNPDDPFANAVFAPVRYALRLPKAQSFFDEVRAAEEKGEQNLTQKASFYTKGFLAYNEIQSSKKMINDVSNHAYYLFLMSQAIRKNPQIYKNPEVLDYCHQIQENLKQSTPFDFEKAAPEMLKFLEYAHVTPEEVGFDSSFKSEMNVEFTSHHFSIGFGWLGKYLGEEKTTN